MLPTEPFNLAWMTRLLSLTLLPGLKTGALKGISLDSSRPSSDFGGAGGSSGGIKSSG